VDQLQVPLVKAEVEVIFIPLEDPLVLTLTRPHQGFQVLEDSSGPRLRED